MAKKQPYYTSATLIDAVRRRASLPKAQSMFSDQDILNFANDELQEHILPIIKSTHEEFFVWIETIDLVQSQDSYKIPSRALGNALRDLAYIDANGNDFEMTRIQRDDRYSTQFPSTYNQPYRFYVENAHIVLEPGPGNAATGQLEFAYLLRPNMLVPSTNVSKVVSINTTTGKVVVDDILEEITTADTLDFLKTKSPHNFLSIDITPTAINYATNTFTFTTTDIPSDLAVGDTIARSDETDIPGIPTEMHRFLVSKTVERVLESLGDTQAVATAARNSTISEMNSSKLIDNRVTSAPLKVKNRNGFLRKKFKRNGKF